jgi:ATP-dependent Clp protease protease subunit
MADDINPNMKNVNFLDDNGNVYILGDFDFTISQNIIMQLIREIENRSRTIDNRFLNIYINSCGGQARELFSLLAVLDRAKAMGITIVTHVLGEAHSCASMLACYGDTRYMSQHSVHGVHLGMVFPGAITTQLQNKRGFENTSKHFDRIVNLYLKHSKFKEKELRKLLEDDDLELSAEECLKYGLCDEIA